MKALVTGGAGFIGSHLADRLVDEGFEILVADDLSKGHVSRLADARARGKVKFHQVDIRTPEFAEALVNYGPEVVFHLAAQASVTASVSGPVHDADVNVLGTINLLEACRAADCRRVVFTSTGGAVYGSRVRLPARETYVKKPDSPYGISKKVVEDYFRWYRDVHGIDYVIIGPSNVYGPRQDPHGEAGVVAIFSRAMLDRRSPSIFGDGSQTRDYVYVEDLVDAIVRASHAGGGMFLNVGTGVETDVNALYRMIATAAGFTEAPVYEAPRPGEVQRSVLDATAATDALGWQPFTSLPDGIERTVEWFRTHG
jgi:UDP-glucose 4-epimerase